MPCITLESRCASGVSGDSIVIGMEGRKEIEKGLTISREGLGERERAKDLFEGLSGGLGSHVDGGSALSAI
jgi:hypothetical protein